MNELRCTTRSATLLAAFLLSVLYNILMVAGEFFYCQTVYYTSFRVGMPPGGNADIQCVIYCLRFLASRPGVQLFFFFALILHLFSIERRQHILFFQPQTNSCLPLLVVTAIFSQNELHESEIIHASCPRTASMFG